MILLCRDLFRCDDGDTRARSVGKHHVADVQRRAHRHGTERRATSKTFSFDTSSAVRTDTTGSTPPSQRTVPVTVRAGWAHSLRA